MSVTMRVIRGRKVKNPKYVIRRIAKIDAYEEGETKFKVRESFYMGKIENDPYKNLSSTQAVIKVDLGGGSMVRNVPIS